MKKLTLIIEQGDDGYWGQIQEFPDVFCQGLSLSELKTDAKEALEIYLDETDANPIKNPNFELAVDLQEFFRIHDFINVTKLAKRTGMNTSLLRQYSKGIKFPSIDQVNRIEKTIKEIGSELLNTHLLNKPMGLS